MQVIILATGETNKLHPLTEGVPSPMVPIVNRPVMEHIIEMLVRHQMKEIVVSLYENPGAVEAYFGNGRRWGASLTYKLQREPWGTAGALKWAQHSLGEPFLVISGDTFVDVDLTAAIAQHKARKSLATVVTHASAGGAQSHTIATNGARQIVPPSECNGSERTYYQTGIYIFEPLVLNLIPTRKVYDIATDLIPSLVEQKFPIDTYMMEGYWNTLDSFHAYEQAQTHYLLGTQNNSSAPSVRYSKLTGNEIASGIWVGRNNIIHPSVRLSPPVYLGDNCWIGRDVELGPNAILGDNVIIDDDAAVVNSTILNHTYIGQLVNLEKRVVNKTLMIDSETAHHTRIVDRFLLDEATPAIVGMSFRRFFDWSIASILLLLLLPFILLLGVLTWLFNGRAFIQEQRVTKRPMWAENDPVLKVQPFGLIRFATYGRRQTVSLWGKILSRLSLHRLPELWNVWRGHLALVGIMPLAPKEDSLITEDWQTKRYDVLPGLTGLWYLQGADTGNNLDTAFISDAYYAATRTWREDFKILGKTPLGWFRRLRG